MSKVEIYTQPGCPYCQKALILLQRKDIAFEHINAPRGSAEREEVIQRSGGQTTVPVIFINDKLIGGCSELLALEKEGKLDSILEVK
ncbi:glutaredoxin 3 [Acetobacteraceae bacterium]|nr:glutaredoxin 3 [Acetobacteraceae bacterium]